MKLSGEIMKKCPYCLNVIQENAQFCLYCMKPLFDKETVQQAKPKKKLRLSSVIIAVIAVVLITILAAGGGFLFASISGSDETTDSYQETTGTSSEEEIELDKIVTYDDFRLQALMATAKLGYNELWNPEELIETHVGADGWNIYSCNINIPEVDLKILFYNDGEEILTVISDVTDETYRDAVNLYECILSGIENYTFINFQQMMTDRDMYAMQKREGSVTMLEEIEFVDPASEKTDAGTEMIIEYRWSEMDNGNLLLYELRTRTYNGKTYYDIYMYNTTE